MTARRGVLLGLFCVVCAGSAQRAHAQANSKQYDVSPVVFLNHIEAVFPGPYFLAQRPNPPVRGYYAWKLIFGERDATVVFRTDSAIASSDDDRVVRQGAMYKCETPEQPMLECATKIGGSARAGRASVTIDITDTSFIRLIRTLRSPIVTRQWFEPGGRFRVDQVMVTYRDPKPR